MKVQYTKSAEALLLEFDSYACKLLYDPCVQEDWRLGYKNIAPQELNENLYEYQNVGMQSDVWLLYGIVAGGVANSYAIANINSANLKRFPEMNIYDFSVNERTLRKRLQELYRNGFLIKINYSYYRGENCYIREDTNLKYGDGGYREASLFLPTSDAVRLVNETLETSFKDKKFVASNPINNVLGAAASAYALSMLTKEVMADPTKMLTFESGMFNNGGTFRCDAEVKIDYLDDRPREYVAFIHGYVQNAPNIPKAIHKKYIETRIEYMFKYVSYRDKKAKDTDNPHYANVIVCVNGSKGMKEFTNVLADVLTKNDIDVDSSEFREKLGHIYITSEGFIKERFSLSGALMSIRDFYAVDKNTGEKVLLAPHVVRQVNAFY